MSFHIDISLVIINVTNENFYLFEFYFLEFRILSCQSWQNKAGFFCVISYRSSDWSLSENQSKVCEVERPNRLRQLMVMKVYSPLTETL